MSRFKSLKANPRRSLAALATVLVAVGVTGASGADFTAQTANAGNTFATGTLSMSNDKAGAILTAANMKPGDPASTGEVKIKNTGTVAGTFKLTRGAVADSDSVNKLSTKLNLIVTDCGADLLCNTSADNSNKYTGTLAAMTAPITLSPNWASLEEHKYEFSVALDSSADNLFAGDNSVVPFTWDAN
jgi:spore coat-associated protein N